MSSKITTFFEDSAKTNALYPRTKTSAISNESGQSLEVLLNTPFSFVGMVVQSTNFSTESQIKAVYGSNTSWSLISSTALASGHVFGNGLSLGMTTGSNNIALGLLSGGSGNPLISGASGGYGANVGTSRSGNSGTTQPSSSLGVKTKDSISEHPEYSGLVADTITVYMWERTA